MRLAPQLEFVRGSGSGTVRQQGTLDAFVQSRVEALRGAAGRVDDASARAPRRRLIVDVYDLLCGAAAGAATADPTRTHVRAQRMLRGAAVGTDDASGLGASAIALALVLADTSRSAAGGAASASAAAAAAKLEPWVAAALLALEDTGHAYRAGVQERFLASVSERRLDEADVDDLFRAAFCPASLWNIAAQEDVQSESERAGRDHGGARWERADERDEHQQEDGESIPEEHGSDTSRRKQRRTAMGALTQLYTTTHEIRRKREAAAAPRTCLWGWKSGVSLHQSVGVGRECAGRIGAGPAHRLWSAALRRTSKAVVYSATMGLAPRPQLGTGAAPTCMEYSASGEYVLCARTDGNLTVFRASSIMHRMRDSWHEAAAVEALLPVRNVRGGLRSVDCAHWNPGNRNELATSSRTSSDVHIFDMKVCGLLSDRGQQHSRNTPTTIFSQRQAQGNGSILDFAFLPSAHSLVIAGTSRGAVLVWDARNPKSTKGVLRQDNGGVCFVKMLRDGHTMVAGTTDGSVHLWDIRAARASMAVMSIAGRTQEMPFSSTHLQPQLPLLNADSDVVPGSVWATSDDTHPRCYALEPVLESQVAFAFGERTVGVLNLLSGRVTHAYHSGSSLPAGPLLGEDAQRRRLAWVSSSSASAHSTVVLRRSDDGGGGGGAGGGGGGCVCLLHLRGPQGTKHSFGHSATSVQVSLPSLSLSQSPSPAHSVSSSPSLSPSITPSLPSSLSALFSLF